MQKRRTTTLNRIVIIGLGLMGGSLAKKIKQRLPEYPILAVDGDGEVLSKAILEGTIDSGVTNWDHWQPQIGDLVVIALPNQCPEALIQYLESVSLEHAIAVMDLGSTKGQLMERISKAKFLKQYFIGVHPMVGSHLSGYEGSHEDLFNEAICFICSGDAKPRVKQLIEGFLSNLGCILKPMDPHEHDKMVAITSHLPHLISYEGAYLYRMNEKELPSLPLAVGTGFISMSRLAYANPKLWTEICMANREALIPLIEVFEKRISDTKKCLMDENVGGLLASLEEGHLSGQHWESKGEQAMPPKSDSLVSVTDLEIDMLRHQLDLIDGQIAELFSKRFDSIRTIGALKAKKHLPVEDIERETVVVERLINKVPKRNAEVMQRLYESVFNESKRVQTGYVNSL